MEEGAKPLEESSGAIESLSIKELKAFLEERGVSYADCFEKSELIARAKESQHIPTKKQPKQHEANRMHGPRQYNKRYGQLDCIIVENSATPEWIIVTLHGYGATNEDFVSLGEHIMNLLKVPIRFIFPNGLRPQNGAGPGREWWPLDLNKLMQLVFTGQLVKHVPDGITAARGAVSFLINEVAKETNLPLSHFVLGGFSQGAMLTTDVFLHLEESLGAAFILSGIMICEDEWRKLAPSRKGMKVVQSHGTQDPLLAYAMGTKLRDTLKEAGVDLEFVSFDGAHTVPPQAISTLLRVLQQLTSQQQ